MDIMDNWRYRMRLFFFINYFGFVKIPVLGYCRPSFVRLDKQQCIIEIRLRRRTQNHLKVMYFGAIAIGAEMSIACVAFREIIDSGAKIDALFKTFQIEFLKRADGDVHFICNDVPTVVDLVERSKLTGERLEVKVQGYAIVPSKGPEPVAKYELTLSVKNRAFAKKS